MNTTLYKNSKLHLALVAALGATLVACGGGGGGAAPAAAGVTKTGIAVDDRIAGADACLNATKANGGSPCVVTDKNGNYTFTNAPSGAKVYITGGTDISTLAPNLGTLIARSGDTVASPLTTLLANNPNLSEATLLASLGLPASTVLGTTDPTAAGNTTLLAIGAAIQQLENQIAAAVTAAGSTKTAADISALIASQIGSTSGALTTGVSGLINSVIASAIPAASSTLATTLNTNVGAGIATSVQAVAASTNATSLVVATTTCNTNTATLTQTVTPSGTVIGLDNILKGGGVGFQGSPNSSSPVMATSTSGGIKSATVTGPLLQAAIALGAASGTPVVNNNLLTIGFDVKNSALGSTQRLQGIVSGIVQTLSGGTAYSVNAANASAQIYGVTSTGATAYATLPASSVISTISAASLAQGTGISAASLSGGILLDIQGILNLVKNSNTKFNGLSSIASGVYNVTFAVSGIQSVSNNAGSALVPTTTISVTGGSSVTGQGETLSVTVQ